MKITIVGTGYVGLVTGACFAEMGHEVICVDIDESKIAQLVEGHVPFYEPGLEELVTRNASAGRLHFTSRISTAMKHCEAVFIAVGTPPGEDGSADLKHVLGVAREIGQCMTEPLIVVNKSTVPVGTAEKVRSTVSQALRERGLGHISFDVVSNPEFLKEGDAISDFMRPDRIVVGVDNDRAKEKMDELYENFVKNGHPIVHADIPTAELIKYASNAMLATRISFMNELSRLCDRVGADIEMVRKGIGTDSRIGMSFLYAGVGYGGSCFPKDVQALQRTMKEYGLEGEILTAVENVNRAQRDYFVTLVTKALGEDLRGKELAVWGLTFKPRTDDLREAPSIPILKELMRRGATVRAYDPEAGRRALEIFPEKGFSLVEDKYTPLGGADALLLLTDWFEFRNPDFLEMKKRLKSPVIVDGRNQYHPEKLKAQGFHYVCIGRGTP